MCQIPSDHCVNSMWGTRGASSPLNLHLQSVSLWGRMRGLTPMSSCPCWLITQLTQVHIWRLPEGGVNFGETACTLFLDVFFFFFFLDVLFANQAGLSFMKQEVLYSTEYPLVLYLIRHFTFSIRIQSVPSLCDKTFVTLSPFTWSVLTNSLIHFCIVISHRFNHWQHYLSW